MNPTKQTIAKARVLVVGDAMLDRYWHGAVERISPEAPVPVVKVSREEERIGAAANVAYNVATLGANFAPWLIILGAVIGYLGLVQLGVLLFGAAVLFQIVTLPVEFNASSRAAQQLGTLGIATQNEVGGTRQVLNAAALS